MTQLSPRTLAVAFGQDLSLFVAWSVLPVWAERELHATPAQLGALPLTGGLAYIAMSLAGGRLSDRVSRTALARLGLLVFAAFCLLAWRATSIEWVYAVSVVGGLGNALVWPGLQALVGDESGPHDLEKNLGVFSLSWSLGKTLGFFVSGYAWQSMGLGALAACGALSALLAPLIPSRPAGHRAVPAPLVAADGPPAPVRAAYLRAAWVANFAAYGLGATLNFLYEDQVAALGRPHLHYNWVLGTVFLAQTASFRVFGRYSRWRYRPGALLFWQLAAAAALAVIGFAAPLPAALAAAAVAGTGLGLAYAASIYYSVHSDEARGQRAGIHEAVIGASNFAIPLAGGWLQHRTGWGPAGYVFSAALVALCVAGQAAILGRGRRAALRMSGTSQAGLRV
jgi:MFS family permease